MLPWLKDKAPEYNSDIHKQAEEHQNNLTKPPGSLGQLEKIAIKLCALQGSLNPTAANIYIAVFAGDHGVAEEGVSAYPQSVTAEMIKNFAEGGAAISVLAHHLNAPFSVVNMGTVGDVPPIIGIKPVSIARGTQNFCKSAAMTEVQLKQSFETGKEVVNEAVAKGLDLFIGGDMGIANTTSASAIICALTNAPPKEVVGPGTGVDEKGILTKIDIVERALVLHAEAMKNAYHVLRCVGGFEIVALAGAYIACAQKGIPVLVDGFITTAAALAAVEINPSIQPWLIVSHKSAEPAHEFVLNKLEAEPILDLDMRLGEASGAAMAVPIIRLACALHNEMASFSSAGVSTGL